MQVPKTTAWDRLDGGSRTRLLEGAEQEIARRSFAGALVYFGTIAVLPLASSCLSDHPILSAAALICTFVGGVIRCVAAARLLRGAAPGSAWALTLQIATLLLVGSWGIYCAAVLYFYAETWPSTYLLVAGAALSGGLVSSLAPHLWLGQGALVLTVLPAGLCALLLGTVGEQVLGVSTCAYLAFLMIQLRNSWMAYWKVATASTLEAMLSRQAATHSQSRFQTLFEDAPNGIYLASPDGRVEMANQALSQMLGFPGPREMTGTNLNQFLLAGDRTETHAPIEESGYLSGWESDWRRLDGTPIRVRESIRAVNAGMDNRARLLGIVEDVTARFIADREHRQLIEILEGTSDFVERITPSEETLYLNRASRAFLSNSERILPTAADTGRESVWSRSGDEESRRARLRFADEEGIWQGESWLLLSGGQPLPISQVIISHRLTEGSAPASYSIISRDISAMRDAQTALKETESRLFQAQRLESLGRLAGGIAHDFNNLLTIIMGYASVLTMNAKDPRERDDIAEISKAAERAANLTKQLLAFGRKQVLSRGVIDVNEVVRGADRMLRTLIGERVDLVTKLSEDPQTVVADAAQLEQVLVNLILNGRDAMPHGGVATIETSTVRDNLVRICVSDTGIGMGEETIARIFEPFFTTKGPARGTGLGLATAYGFIQQSGGTISVSSELGVGTTFEIRLPKSENAAPESLENLQVSGQYGNERILVVDDEPALRSLLRQTLAGYGYDVAEAASGEEALTLANDSPRAFDLLVTDVIMPGITGPQLAKRLRSAFPNLAVLFVSGYAGETEAERSVFGPGEAYLPKPFSADALLWMVRQQLERTRTLSSKA
jgi:PAS domain S-box-containing protein